MKDFAVEPWNFETADPQVMFRAGLQWGDPTVHVESCYLTPDQARRAADEWPAILRHMANVAEGREHAKPVTD